MRAELQAKIQGICTQGYVFKEGYSLYLAEINSIQAELNTLKLQKSDMWLIFNFYQATIKELLDVIKLDSAGAYKPKASHAFVSRFFEENGYYQQVRKLIEEFDRYLHTSPDTKKSTFCRKSEELLFKYCLMATDKKDGTIKDTKLPAAMPEKYAFNAALEGTPVSQQQLDADKEFIMQKSNFITLSPSHDDYQ
jgi:hypothetical protein